MALDGFFIEWDTDRTQTFFEETVERDIVPPDSPLKHFFAWSEFTARGKNKSLGPRFEDLYFRSHGLPDEDEWQFERPLGHGSFGAAALFVRRNEEQKQTDVGRPSCYPKCTSAQLIELCLGVCSQSHRGRPESFLVDPI